MPVAAVKRRRRSVRQARIGAASPPPGGATDALASIQRLRPRRSTASPWSVPRLEHDVGGQAVHVPLEGEEARGLLRDGRADAPGDQVERQVVPRRRRAGGDDLGALAAHHQHLLGVERRPRKTLPEPGRRSPSGSSPPGRRPGPSRRAGTARSTPSRAARRARACGRSTPRGRVAAAPQRPPRREHRGHQDDVGRVHLVDAARRRDRRAPSPSGSGPRRSADDLDLERRRAMMGVCSVGRSPPTTGRRGAR